MFLLSCCNVSELLFGVFVSIVERSGQLKLPVKPTVDQWTMTSFVVFICCCVLFAFELQCVFVVVYCSFKVRCHSKSPRSVMIFLISLCAFVCVFEKFWNFVCVFDKFCNLVLFVCFYKSWRAQRHAIT